ncbi:MAG: hypothetical protein K2M43_03480 [Mycoplasmoidaceae bacterium]|nr:hypothetical protein [Mycoplasmoidaceae bacterium]
MMMVDGQQQPEQLYLEDCYTDTCIISTTDTLPVGEYKFVLVATAIANRSLSKVSDVFTIKVEKLNNLTVNDLQKTNYEIDINNDAHANFSEGFEVTCDPSDFPINSVK